MVQALVDGLAGRKGIELHHVNLPLSRDSGDIGRIRPGKLWVLLRACLKARRLARAEGLDTLYYVPAPGKRSALYRDWIAMALCRPACRRLVLHWHASGLGEWLRTRATAPERRLTLRSLGAADLSIVLAGSLRADADMLGAKRVAVVPNGIADPCPGLAHEAGAKNSFCVLFLGLCSEEKGLFDAAEAVVAANRQTGASGTAPALALTAAGPFPDSATRDRFSRLVAMHPAALRHAGVVTGEQKHLLFLHNHALCLPTHYPHEGQPLVLLEAMAYDLPVISTRWGAIPETVPADGAQLVSPENLPELTQALLSVRASPPPAGIMRQHFLSRFSLAAHLDALARALQSE
jgi:glycosyltransferase involved in cell wall biosynthesis